MAKNCSKKQTNIPRPSQSTAIDPSVHILEYDKLRDAIVEANQIIKDKEAEIEKKKIEDDYLTLPLILFLRAIFGAGIVLLGLCVIAGMLYSYTLFEFPVDTLQASLTSAFWIAFILNIITLLAINRRHKRHQTLNKKAIIIIYGILLLIGGIPYVIELFLNTKLVTVISIVIVCIMLLVFCYLAIRTLKQEADRSFLVSYFSAIVSIAALVVSAVTLFISQQ
ncbi:hypothetical protein [Lutispora sp.]|uniref:hypothetical protein n=1 Tax=Lutispora sp. TaxID=2828727 RepID=UPI002B1F878F|nr:hypothetical protein [Lutispora sp.]MEA4962600.1 hypothetical protein [Lutispora sp.]